MRPARPGCSKWRTCSTFSMKYLMHRALVPTQFERVWSCHVKSYSSAQGAVANFRSSLAPACAAQVCCHQLSGLSNRSLLPVRPLQALLECLMYKLSYYKFAEASLMTTGQLGYDRVRNTQIGKMDISLEYFEEVLPHSQTCYYFL